MPEQEIPNWVDDTWPEQTYELQIMGDTSQELIDMTRDEYITLKAHLAAMRGYKVPMAAEAIALVKSTESLDIYHSDDYQVARHIEIARDIYQELPELVMIASEDFDAEIRKLAEHELEEPEESSHATPSRPRTGRTARPGTGDNRSGRYFWSAGATPVDPDAGSSS